jgi:excisionase family DNA binding protein
MQHIEAAHPEDLLLPHEAAAAIGITPDTLRRWANEGVLPYQRTRKNGHRRFRRADVDALIASGSFPAAEPAEQAS